MTICVVLATAAIPPAANPAVAPEAAAAAVAAPARPDDAAEAAEPAAWIAALWTAAVAAP